MRPSLRHPLAAPRRVRRDRRRRGVRGAHRSAAPNPGAAAVEPAGAAAAEPARAAPEAVDAEHRLRRAGGPTDQASYICHCGCLFAAAVTTTVQCPHCGAPQMW